ncbi:MAG: ribonucleotide-diphosphate reductase subunit beta [Candidatus Pacebacteria bacterium]|nr:ribonucleotide-diphosphate reductase subunit beta [Candidatus Paceibacterota bacterium]
MSPFINTVLKYVKKRDESLQKFDIEKIANAIYKAMSNIGVGSVEDANKVADKVAELLEKRFDKAKKEADTNNPNQIDKKILDTVNGTFWIEDVQDIVEEALMSSEYHSVAKAYIIYREERAKLRKRDIFAKRINLKPYEYPELYEYVSAIRHSYWVHTEFNFVKDIQDFKVEVSEKEKNAIKNSMLAIAQIEVAVKTFWGDIYKKMPKSEIGAVGSTFAESEVRHTDAYAHLLELLGLNEEFTKIKDTPALMDRVKYLNKSIANSRSEDNKEYALSVLLFSLFIEHVSLFSQFLIIMSFNKKRFLFKGISNAIEATSKEEQIHGLFGIDLINIIRDEHPEWFDEDYNNTIIKACEEAYGAEKKVVDWIFEAGELDFLSKTTVLEFVKNRLNNSLDSIGLSRIFEVDSKLLEETNWFNEEVIVTKHVDFFGKKSINYNKRSQSITGDDLF